MLFAPSELDESDAVPAHVPVMDIDPDGPVIELVPQAAANVNRTTAIVFFMMSYAPARRTPVETLRGSLTVPGVPVGPGPRCSAVAGFSTELGRIPQLSCLVAVATRPYESPGCYFLIMGLLAGCILAMAVRCAVTLVAKTDTRFASGVVDWTSFSSAVSWVFNSL